MPVICIEGNIGAGKSSVLDHMSKWYKVYKEPVESWHMLEDFYDDRKRFGFAFQMQVMLSMRKIFKDIETITETFPDVTLLVERSPWSMRYVFFQMLKDSDSWDDAEVSSFEKTYESLFERTKIDYYIFLNVAESKLVSRIESRDRYAERNVSEAYVRSVNVAYEKALKNLTEKYIEIDGNGDKASTYDAVKSAIENIRMQNNK